MTVWPVAVFFLGGVATQGSAWLAHRRRRAERTEDAVAELARRREEFELAHLVEVHGLLRAYADALHEYTSAVGAERRSARRDDATSTGSPLAAWEQMEAAKTAVGAQVGFVLDDDIRALVDDARRMVAGTADIVSMGNDDPEIWLTSEGLDEVYAAISARVREIYAGRAGAPRGGSPRLPT